MAMKESNKTRKKRQSLALAELVRISEEMGGYDTTVNDQITDAVTQVNDARPHNKWAHINTNTISMNHVVVWSIVALIFALAMVVL